MRVYVTCTTHLSIRQTGCGSKVKTISGPNLWCLPACLVTLLFNLYPLIIKNRGLRNALAAARQGYDPQGWVERMGGT